MSVPEFEIKRFPTMEELMKMNGKALMAEAAPVTALMKAALTRQVMKGKPIIGHENPDDLLVGQELKYYRWDFEDPDNIRFVEEGYMAFAKSLLQVAEARAMTAISALFTPQLRHAMQNGSLSRWSYTEINAILNPPPPRPSATVLSFAPRAPKVQPT